MLIKKTIVQLFVLCLIAQNTHAQLQKFNHDYSQTLVMKMLLSIPDGKGGTKVYCNFSQALELIKKADQLTMQVPKIIYLVGWQYNGHDDKYPAMFEVNEALKRPQDTNAREGLLWLMKEARKYNTAVSLHINMTDAYEDSPLWETYVENDLISKKRSGDLLVIGNYNNRKAYQINYKREWESGWTQKRIDSLLKLLPELKNSGTIHADAWIARASEGHQETSVMEAAYQVKATAYWKKNGLDVTSEWVMDYMTGYVPFAWHFNHRTQEQYLETPAAIYTGSGINPDMEWSDFGLGFLFGTSMYGEPIWPNKYRTKEENDTWERRFARKFYLNSIPYFFLNKHRRKYVEGAGAQRIAYYDHDLRVSLKDSTISKNEVILRKGNTILLPPVWKKEPSLVAYSGAGINEKYQLLADWSAFKRVDLYKITTGGLEKVKTLSVKNGFISLNLEKQQPYLLKPRL
ncbi:endo-alpha-N-acetylgalactosaminidase family protein [Zhouia spongiae]|uniref:Endo-alpha-N-acetylgalactosaminidase family protein n=1 Tax=Zhouia spongiae TaxID=2202721 RepID=A0ABY3YGX6_9FLAO|nr:endo-alpha-N-acetylgalactosaminidase family protein [Zhouia spongiae]UNY97230.1 endo-alpha-N-acetylgalactosaminidase family protein [Zhouia spongiae]